MSVALIVLVAILVVLLVILFATVKVAREYERGVIFRLGRLLPNPKGPGLFLLIPVIDRMEKVDLRTVTLNVPPQEVITKRPGPFGSGSSRPNRKMTPRSYSRVILTAASRIRIRMTTTTATTISAMSIRPFRSGSVILRRARGLPGPPRR
jgi:hypothetical protein